MPETPLSLIQYFKNQHILKGLGDKRKNHLKYLVGPTLGVEFPPVTGCGAIPFLTEIDIAEICETNQTDCFVFH